MDDNIHLFPTYYDKEEFPTFMIDKWKDLNIIGLTIKDLGGKGMS